MFRFIKKYIFPLFRKIKTPRVLREEKRIYELNKDNPWIYSDGSIIKDYKIK